MEIRKEYLTNNDCYKANRTIIPTGIVIHSTGCNQKKISAFTTQWNKPNVSVCVHAFVGIDVDGKLKVVQTLPWNHRSWSCGSGKKGSYNNSHIQFEICEDNLIDEVYFSQVYGLAVELCAYLCNEYNISVDNITTHCDAYQAGYASNHADVMHWFPRYGKNMDIFRADVKNKLTATEVKSGWIKDGNRWWYRHADGNYTKDGWEQIEDKWYYFNKDGWMITGWLNKDGKWYYLKEDGSMAENEMLTITSSKKEIYCFGDDGHMLMSDSRGALV